MDRPEYLYKYTSYYGAKEIITNCSVKLSVPTAFNDPFDILLEEALGSEIEEFLGDLLPTFFDFVAGEFDHGLLRHGSMRDAILRINTHLRNMAPKGELECVENF
jgi:hypothetical protein